MEILTLGAPVLTSFASEGLRVKFGVQTHGIRIIGIYLPKLVSIGVHALDL